jgi:DNA-directed RNA polymerase I subunit RPA1
VPKGKAAAGADATLSDAEEGESTEEPSETIDEYNGRLQLWVRSSLAKATDQGRDEYKKSGIVYDRRKRVIAEFLKSLTKKKCDRCGA